MKKRQCPECGCSVVETLTSKGWGIICGTCDYATKDDYKSRYEARVQYREDYSQAFDKGTVPIDVETWQSKLDRGEL